MTETTTKRVDIGELYLSNTLLSFFYGYEPYLPRQPKPGDFAKFLCHFLMAPNHPDLVRVAAKIEEVGAAKWKEQWPAIREQLKGQDKLCLHRGDISKAGRPEYAGRFYVSGSGPNSGRVRFSMFAPDGVTQAVPGDGLLYSGVRANAKISIWAQDNANGKRINCTITGVQHLGHSPAFTSGPPPAAPGEFGNVSGADAPVPGAGAADPTGGLLG